MKHFGPCRLDTLNQTLWRDDSLLTLPPRPYAVLQYLVEHPGRLITHNEFMEALWPGTYVQPQVLRTYVLELRKLLGDDAANPHFIATVPKRGYRFLSPVTEAAPHSMRAAGAVRPDEGPVVAAASEIVGRAAELAKLGNLMQRACDGERQVVFISGEPGIGKTALVDAFCVDGCGDVRVGRGHSVEHFGGREPLYPVKELLRDLANLCGGDKGDKTVRLLERIGLGLQGPGLQDLGTGNSTEGKRAGKGVAAAAPATTVRAEALAPGDICAALEALAQETPLLLVFEDLQWADEGTLDLFSALARRRGHARLMLIATCRAFAGAASAGSSVRGRAVSQGGDTGSTVGDLVADAERVREEGGEDRAVPTLRALKQDLVMKRLSAVLQLGPLDRNAVREYVERALGAGFTAEGLRGGARLEGASSAAEKSGGIVPAGLIAFLQEQSKGNPLFLSALLDHLIAERVLVCRAGGWGLRGPLDATAIGVPATLREMIELEVEALGAGEQRLLEAASVAGVVFPVWAVAAVLNGDAGGDLTEVEERFEALARRVDFIRGAGHDELPDGTRSTSYVFAHPYYRAVLYQRQPEVRRSRGHQRVAERLGALFAGDEDSVAAEITEHYEAAGNWKFAAQALAGMSAGLAHAGQRESAIELLERALGLLGNLGQRERGSLEAELRKRLRDLVATSASTVAKTSTKKAAEPIKTAGSGKKTASKKKLLR